MTTSSQPTSTSDLSATSEPNLISTPRPRNKTQSNDNNEVHSGRNAIEASVPSYNFPLNHGETSLPTTASAVYRWYDVEEGFSRKKREESAIAKCKLCQEQGKMDRKTCVRFSKSVTSNLWRHLKETHPRVYEKHSNEKKNVPMHRVVGVKRRGRKKKETSMASATDRCNRPMKTAKGEEKQPLTRLGPDHQVDVVVSHGEFHVDRRVTDTVGVNTTTGSSGFILTGKSHVETIREAMGYLCLYEMVPFELCSSYALYNLMMTCAGTTGNDAHDFTTSTVLTKDSMSGYVKNMAAEIKLQTVIQMKSMDFLHLMLSEWRWSDHRTVLDTATATSMTSTLDFIQSSDAEMVFVALFAVGLDKDFTPFRRCLHVSPIEHYNSPQHQSIAAMLAGDKELTKAMEHVVSCRDMPHILAVEPPGCGYQSFAVDNKLHLLESLPIVIQNIVLATLNGARISRSYCLANNALDASATCSSVGFRNRRLDKGEYIESTSAAVAAALSSDVDCCGVPTAESASSIIQELPTSLTGHTYRDLMNKAMYLLAHFKQSSNSRKVLRKLALEQCSMSAVSYERLFIDRLREMTISLDQIYSVLALVEAIMPAIQKYFSIHKDNDSDFSKLIQLASLSQYEWSRVRYLTLILKPFAEATARLDAEPFVVSSLIVPSVFTLIEKMREFRPVSVRFTGESYNGLAHKTAAETMNSIPEDIEALTNMAFTNLIASFGFLFSVPETSWSKEKLQTFNLLWSATILDPRTRSFIVKGPLSQQQLWEIVKTEAANVAGTTQKIRDNGPCCAESSITLGNDSSHLDENNAGKRADLWDDLQAKLASCAEEETLLSSTKSSLERIKPSNLLDVETSIFQEEGRIVLRANPLEWWQLMRMKYPCLARLARYVLSIPCKVKVDNNPVLCDGGLVKLGPSRMNMTDLCDLLAASMNLRTDKDPHFEAARKHIWSTV